MSNLQKNSNRIVWLIPLFILFQILEEFFFFPEWVTRHFTPMSRSFFLYSYMPLIGIASFFAYYGSKYPKNKKGIFWCAVIAGAMLADSLFHLVTTLFFWEYSPGVVVGTFLYLPFSIYLFRKLLKERILTRKNLIQAIVVGALTMILIIFLSLYFF